MTLLFCIAIYQQSFAQLIPATGAFDTGFLKATTERMAMFSSSNGKPVQRGTITTRIRLKEDKMLIITQVSMNGSADEWTDSSIAYKTTGEPVYHSSYNQQRSMVLQFGKIITGWYRDKRDGQHQNIADTISGSYFDSNLYPSLIGWLPMHEGYQAELAVYDFRPGTKSGLKKVYIKQVVSDHYLTDGLGERKVWKVTVMDEISQGVISTYYFDKTDRKLWKLDIDFGQSKTILKAIE